MLSHMSLFSGVGGIDLAAEWAGFETVGQCEFADFPTKVLEKHWPDVPRWRDVRDVTVESFRERTGIESPTLLSGGFPCQPHSLAGKRKASDDERDLWPEYRRIICETNPKWILGENVTGIRSSDGGRFFGSLLNDLAGMGFDVGWCSIRASWVGALHRRERVFIVAHSNRFRRSGLAQSEQNQCNGIDKKMLDATQAWKGSDAKSLDLLHAGSRIIMHGNGIAVRNDNGIPEGLDRLKCLGNAVVPQQVYPILKIIADIERTAHAE